MPSVLDRSALEQSPLADLHLLANELGVDGFRRLRKPELVDAILARQSGDGRRAARRRRGRARGLAEAAETDRATTTTPKRSRRGRRGGRGRRRDEEGDGARSSTATSPRRGAAARGASSSRAPSSCWPTAPASCALVAARADRRRRLHLGRPGQALRARLGRQDQRPDAPAAPLGALPVAGPRRHHQRPPGRRGRRGHALRGPARRVAGRAHRARLRGPDGEGDRVADAVRQGLARRHRGPVARGQERGAAAARRGARRARGARGQRRAGRRAPGGDRRLRRSRRAPR